MANIKQIQTTGGLYDLEAKDYTSDGKIAAEFQNVRAVAEGKCNSYTLSYSTSAPTSSTNFSQTPYYYKADGTKINNWTEFSTYTNGLTIKNSVFNSNNDYVQISSGYVLTSHDQGYIIIRSNDSIAYLKRGDVFIVYETEVPDRWYEPTGLRMMKLETSKVDLTGYVNAASDGLTLTANSSGKTVSHTNSVAAQTTQGLYPVKIDAQGHISAYGAAVGNATTSAAGLMSSTDKTKLDAIVEAGTVGSATKGIYLNSGVPTAMTYELNKTVPSDAVFTDTTYSVATTSSDGLMSSTDKTKLNNFTLTDVTVGS